MADQFKLDSELASQMPMQQAVPTQPSAGGGGLLDILGGLASGIGEIAAYRQAALGNPAPLQMMQEQRQQENLLKSLQQMSQGEAYGELAPAIQSALQIGGPKAAQKIALQAPAFKSVQEMLKNSTLDPEYKTAIQNAALVDPSRALDLYGRAVSLKETASRIKSTQEATSARQAKGLETKQQIKTQGEPGNLLRTAIDLGQIDPNSDTFAEDALGYLRDRGVKVPTSTDGQDAFMKQLLKSPRLPKQPDFITKLKTTLGFGQPAKAPTTPAQPVTKAAVKQGVRKFNPATGQLE